MCKSTITLCRAILLTFTLAFGAYAQQASTGSIAGTVTDPSGQVVPGAPIKLLSN